MKRRRALGMSDEAHLDDLREQLHYAEDHVDTLERGLKMRPPMEAMTHAGSIESMAGAGPGIVRRLERLDLRYKRARAAFGAKCLRNGR